MISESNKHYFPISCCEENIHLHYRSLAIYTRYSMSASLMQTAMITLNRNIFWPPLPIAFCQMIPLLSFPGQVAEFSLISVHCLPAVSSWPSSSVHQLPQSILAFIGWKIAWPPEAALLHTRGKVGAVCVPAVRGRMLVEVEGGYRPCPNEVIST